MSFWVAEKKKCLKVLPNFNTQFSAAQLPNSLMMDVLNGQGPTEHGFRVAARGKYFERYFQILAFNSFSYGTITPKPLLLNCPIHLWLMYWMVLIRMVQQMPYLCPQGATERGSWDAEKERWGKDVTNVDPEPLSCGTIKPKPMLLNCLIHLRWMYWMVSLSTRTPWVWIWVPCPVSCFVLFSCWKAIQTALW